MALQQRRQRLAEALHGQRHIALFHALVDALHEPGPARRSGPQCGNPAIGQRRVVEPAVIGAVRGQHQGLSRAAGLQIQRRLLRDVQHAQLREKRLYLPMPGMGRVAGQGHAAHAQGREPARPLQQMRSRARRGLRIAAQRLCAIGHGQLHQPVLGIGLVVHGQALALQVPGAGLHEQAHEIRARCRPHAAKNADRPHLRTPACRRAPARCAAAARSWADPGPRSWAGWAV